MLLTIWLTIQQWARSAPMIDFGVWRGRLNTVVQSHHQHQAGRRRFQSFGGPINRQSCFAKPHTAPDSVDTRPWLIGPASLQAAIDFRQKF